MVYELRDGSRLVLNPRRQAKKVIMEAEHLSPRQFRRARKALNRQKKAADRARQEARGAR